MDSEELEDFQIPQEVLDQLSDPLLLQKYVDEGKTFQEILGYSDDMMGRFYQIARGLLDMKKLKEASDAFLFLTTLNPHVPTYWLGLGMCEHLHEEYQRSLVAYGMAIVSDREDPLPHYYSAACHFAMRNYETAKVALEIAIRICADREECLQVKEMSERSLAGVENRLRERWDNMSLGD